MAFAYLEVLNFSYNVVQKQEALYFCGLQLPMLKTLVVTGNPFVISQQIEKYLGLLQIL